MWREPSLFSNELMVWRQKGTESCFHRLVFCSTLEVWYWFVFKGQFVKTPPKCKSSSHSCVCAHVSCPVSSPPAGLVVVGMLCFYWAEAQVQMLHTEWDSLLSQTLLYMPSVLHIVYTNVLATVYKTVAQSLTEYGEWELWIYKYSRNYICLRLMMINTEDEVKMQSGEVKTRERQRTVIHLIRSYQ